MSDLQTPSDSTDTSQSSLLTPSEEDSTGTNSPVIQHLHPACRRRQAHFQQRNIYENCTPPTRPGYRPSKSGWVAQILEDNFSNSIRWLIRQEPETIEFPNTRRKRGATFTALHEHKNDKPRPDLGKRTWTASTPDVLEACEGIDATMAR